MTNLGFILDTLTEFCILLSVNLPAMVANSTMDQESVHILREYVQELMKCVLIRSCFMLQILIFSKASWLSSGSVCFRRNMRQRPPNIKIFRDHDLSDDLFATPFLCYSMLKLLKLNLNIIVS